MAEDVTLLSRIKAGDQSAFEELLKSNDTRLFNVALKITQNRAAAEDAVGDTYEKLIVCMNKIRNPAALDSWLISTVKNKAIDYLRKNKRVVQLDDWAENAEYYEHDRTETVDVVRCMAALPEQQAAVLLMYAEGFKLREIADFNHISVTTAWALLNKAKKKFTEYFKKD